MTTKKIGKHEVTLAGDLMGHHIMFKNHRGLHLIEFVRFMCMKQMLRVSPRGISTGKLNASQRLHIRPITM